MESLKKEKVNKVLLDSNFLMVPFNYKIDIYEEIKFLLGKVKLYTTNACINELRKIWKKKKLGEAAIKLAKIKGVEIINVAKGNVDEILLKVCKENNFILATLDKKLLKEGKELGIKLITLKDNKLIFYTSPIF